MTSKSLFNPRRLKQIWDFLNDPDVGWLPKAIGLAALFYVIWPLDLIPGLALPLFGWLDDATVVAGALNILNFMLVQHQQRFEKEFHDEPLFVEAEEVEKETDEEE